MHSTITINVVEPGNPAVDPAVPNTGLFTGDIGAGEIAVMVSATTICALVVFLLFFLLDKKKHTASSSTIKRKKSFNINIFLTTKHVQLWA